jgi:hypothetical protein
VSIGAVRVLAAAFAIGLAGPTGADASQLITRDATRVRLAVNTNNEALISYRERGSIRRVLAWGAINALPPTRGARQVKLRLDYSGGWGTRRRHVWKGFANACRPYDGPPLQWLVTACKAPDGTYWALQRWQRGLPNVGLPPANALQGSWDLRLSHWSGDPPKLWVSMDWAYAQRYHHLFGSFTYAGSGVYGFRSTSAGDPLDPFGRNLYVDTYDSAYGRGWRRENSFLTHGPDGTFCYGFYPNQNGMGRPSGMGTRYRATIIGPGVTPDAYWESAAPGAYDAEVDRQAYELQRSLFARDTACRPR